MNIPRVATCGAKILDAGSRIVRGNFSILPPCGAANGEELPFEKYFLYSKLCYDRMDAEFQIGRRLNFSNQNILRRGV
jgi:hypothetical protein